jgi:hypothetical protein
MNEECDVAQAIRGPDTARLSLPPQAVETISLGTETVLVVEDEEPLGLLVRIMASSRVIPYCSKNLLPGIRCLPRSIRSCALARAANGLPAKAGL